MKRHPSLLRQPVTVIANTFDELFSKPVLKKAVGMVEQKISEQESFDATPAGAALVKFRRALHAAVLVDLVEDPPGQAKEHGTMVWTACRAAETELIAEIKRLQEFMAENTDGL